MTIRKTPGERLRANIAKGMEVRREQVWHVTTDEFVGRLFCDVSEREDVALFVAFMADPATSTRSLPTDTDGIVCVDVEPPFEHMTVPESYMPQAMSALRRNGVRGTYRARGTEREYRF